MPFPPTAGALPSRLQGLDAPNRAPGRRTFTGLVGLRAAGKDNSSCGLFFPPGLLLPTSGEALNLTAFGVRHREPVPWQRFRRQVPA